MTDKRRARRRLALARHLLVAAIAFTATTAGIQRLAGTPDVGLLEEKLAYFARHQDELEVLFFGSSRIYRGIDPTVFDRALAERGRPMRSFNFGIAGMGAHETNALMRRVLRRRPARLRWVVIELDDWDPTLHERNRLKRRGILWHDAPETLSALRSTWLLDTPLAERSELALAHLTHFAAHVTAAGRALELLDGARPDEPGAFERRGFETFSRPSYDTHPMRRHFLGHLAGYRDAVAALPAANAAEVSLDGYNTAALAAQVARVRAAGAEPVYVIPPTARATPALYRLEKAGVVPWLLAFNDPGSYPELFDVERRFDLEHLTGEGAEAFSRHLAARFETQVAAHAGPAAAQPDRL